MLVKELIDLLLEEDQEAEVCVCNDPIRYIDSMPYYYDGRLSFVERDEKEVPVKCGWRNSGTKVKIVVDTVEDAILDNPEVEVEFSAYGSEKWVENTRIEGRNLQAKLKEIREHR